MSHRKMKIKKGNSNLMIPTINPNKKQIKAITFLKAKIDLINSIKVQIIQKPDNSIKRKGGTNKIKKHFTKKNNHEDGK